MGTSALFMLLFAPRALYGTFPIRKPPGPPQVYLGNYLRFHTTLHLPFQGSFLPRDTSHSPFSLCRFTCRAPAVESIEHTHLPQTTTSRTTGSRLAYRGPSQAEDDRLLTSHEALLLSIIMGLLKPNLASALLREHVSSLHAIELTLSPIGVLLFLINCAGLSNRLEKKDCFASAA